MIRTVIFYSYFVLLVVTYRRIAGTMCPCESERDMTILKSIIVGTWRLNMATSHSWTQYEPYHKTSSYLSMTYDKYILLWSFQSNESAKKKDKVHLKNEFDIVLSPCNTQSGSIPPRKWLSGYRPQWQRIIAASWYRNPGDQIHWHNKSTYWLWIYYSFAPFAQALLEFLFKKEWAIQGIPSKLLPPLLRIQYPPSNRATI